MPDTNADFGQSTVTTSIREAAQMLGTKIGAGAPVTESTLQACLAEAIAKRTANIVERERHVGVPGFQGVGPFDIVVKDAGNGVPLALIECKWSTDPARSKIYECAWDAVKLALAVGELPAAAGYLVTGAPKLSWGSCEVKDLFWAGNVETQELWGRQLSPPGPNGGTTVGADCEAGGYGNMFTHAHALLKVGSVASLTIPDTDVELRASQISGSGPLVRYAEDPEFPATIRDSWLHAHVPGMPEDQFERLLDRLGKKRWTQAEIKEKVLPLRSSP